MRKTIAALGAALLLAGCGTTVAGESSAPSPAAQQSDLNERGNRELSLGERGVRINCDEANTGECLNFAVTDIADVDSCTKDYAPEPQGRAIKISVDLETKSIAQDKIRAVSDTFNPNNWKWLLDNGQTEAYNQTSEAGKFTYECEESTMPPALQMLSPNSTYSGAFILDVPKNAKKLVLYPNTSTLGWEWELPEFEESKDTKVGDESKPADDASPHAKQSRNAAPQQQQPTQNGNSAPAAGGASESDYDAFLDSLPPADQIPGDPGVIYDDPAPYVPAPDPYPAPSGGSAPALPDGAGGGEAGY